jgi:hypothetical protein
MTTFDGQPLERLPILSQAFVDTRIKTLQREINVLVESFGPEAWSGQDTDADAVVYRRIEGIGLEIDRLRTLETRRTS